MVRGGASWVALASLGLGACVSPQESSSLVPSQPSVAWGASPVARVALGELRLAMEPGASMGGKYDAFGVALGDGFAAPDGLSAEQQKRFRDAVIRVLATHGIALDARDEAIGLDDSWRAPRILCASVVEMRTEIRQGSSREEIASRVRVEWEILDRESGEVVHRGTSTGQSSAAANAAESQMAAFHEAAAVFFRASPTIAALREPSAGSVSPAAFRPGEPVELPAPQAERGEPASPESMLQAASSSVFSIRNPSGHGSGFFVREDGLALTSRHVVEGRKYWDAFLADGRSVRMQVVREDWARDVALLKASGEGPFSPLLLGDSGGLRLGEEIWAMGTPVSLTLSQSVSRGIVSALRVEAERTLVQTDAALNPGSSGGPVLNRRGEVIGIANLKLRARDVEGIAFCTAIHDARNALNLALR